MPIYEYKCEKCHREFELFQGFDAPTTAKCIHCKSESKRLISRPAIHFKGSGFHATDYSRGTSGRAAASGDGKSKLKAKASSDSKKSETSPPAKKDSSTKAQSA